MSKRLDQSRQPARLRRRFSLKLLNLKTSGYLRHSHCLKSAVQMKGYNSSARSLAAAQKACEFPPHTRSLSLAKNAMAVLACYRIPFLKIYANKSVWLLNDELPISFEKKSALLIRLLRWLNSMCYLSHVNTTQPDNRLISSKMNASNNQTTDNRQSTPTKPFVNSYCDITYTVVACPVSCLSL
jgi:hypothetical protein